MLRHVSRDNVERYVLYMAEENGTLNQLSTSFFRIRVLHISHD
jgi:hypothetical protein